MMQSLLSEEDHQSIRKLVDHIMRQLKCNYWLQCFLRLQALSANDVDSQAVDQLQPEIGKEIFWCYEWLGQWYASILEREDKIQSYREETKYFDRKKPSHSLHTDLSHGWRIGS